MQIKAIAAVAENGVIGNHGAIPWRVPEDWRRFRRITTGHTLVMGRTTYEGIATSGGPLPGRLSIVVTRDRDWTPSGVDSLDPHTQVMVAHGVEEAIDLARKTAKDRTCWIAGGGEIYRAAMPYLMGWDLSRIPIEAVGDVTLPQLAPDQWRVIYREPLEGFTVEHYAPVVRTPRLQLEPVSADDTEDWSRLFSDLKLYQRHPEVVYSDNEYVDQMLSANVTSWIETGIGYWLARDPQTHELRGLGGIRRRTERGETFWNLHYRLPEDEQGRGYAQEISRAAIAQLAKLDPKAEVRALIRPGHHGSEAVAHRLGLIDVGDMVDDLGRPSTVHIGFVNRLAS